MFLPPKELYEETLKNGNGKPKEDSPEEEPNPDYTHLWKDIEENAADGYEPGLEKAIAKLERTEKEDPDFNLKYDPSEVKQKRVECYINRLSRNAASLRDIEHIVKTAKQRSEGFGIPFDEDSTQEYVALKALDCLMEELKKDVKYGDYFPTKECGYELGSFGKHAGNIKNIIKSIPLPEEKADEISSSLINLLYDVRIKRIELLQNALPKPGEGHTTMVVYAIENEVEEANEVGAIIGKSVEIKPEQYRDYANRTLDDLKAITPSFLLTHTDETRKMRSDCNGFILYVNNSDMDSDERRKIAAELNETATRLEQGMFQTLSEFAAHKEKMKPMRALGLRFETLLARYQNFYNDFLEELGETEEDVAETIEGLKNAYATSEVV